MILPLRTNQQQLNRLHRVLFCKHLTTVLDCPFPECSLNPQECFPLSFVLGCRCVSSDIQTVRSRRSRVFFKRLRGVWISYETRFRVFDMASQMINNSWRNSRLKLTKFYGNKDHISKPRSQSVIFFVFS